jgi:hypothetical protein
MKVHFELGNHKGLRMRINPHRWLQWCREGTQSESLQKECEQKTRKIHLHTDLSHPILPKTKSMPRCDYKKLMRLGLLNKKTKPKCTTNPKGMFSKGYKHKKFNPLNYHKRRHEYIP